MRIADMDWQSVEDWTRHDDRAVLPLGSTEQHAGLSLATDSILAERVSIEAAQPLDVPVFPVLPYGVAPAFAAFPGSVNLRVATFALVIRDVLDSLKRSGFRRLLIVNGHGGNQPAASVAQEWMMDNPDARVRFHDWWRAPATLAAIRAIDPEGGHASWFENFAWTRLNGQAPMHSKPDVDVDRLRTLPPFEVRALLEDGCYGGLYQRDESDMRQVWSAAVAETRAMIDAW
jgi:creatinine amidohydrolase